MIREKVKQIRNDIGTLIYEQSLYVIEGNDQAVDAIDEKIARLRVLLSEIESGHLDIDDHID